MSLFDDENSFQPLAARMRPRSLDDFLGQEHLLGAGKPLRESIESSALYSMVLWGPPGVGKTTLARMIAELCDVHFESISAVLAGVKEIRTAIAQAQQQRLGSGRKTLLFVDEAHRFNKAQQDAFLPFVEDGTVIFIGATTENPSFELNNALLSRTRVYKLRSMTEAVLVEVIERALADEQNGLGRRNLRLSKKVKGALALAADGDARKALNLVEIAADLAGDDVIDDTILKEVLAGDSRRFDKGGDLFYEQISALHKAVRGSSPDAALYWFVRMIDAGCDPLYIARRVVRMASEDIGNADPRALQLALNGWEVQERLGSPEGELALAQAVLYLASAAKSNAAYTALQQAKKEVESTPSYDVPMHLRNAPTGMMEDMGYGSGYRYAHDDAEAYVAGESYFPPELDRRRYYHPVPRGLEIRIKEKLEQLRQLDADSGFSRYGPAGDSTDGSEYG
jgi:putative ATPase|tara:strand:+ start:1777 stop:3135 length:1359 start_codon:yes stop_codon:yes gene_type:complete